VVNWSSEVDAADWIVARLHPFARDVGSLVPAGYPAYVRILHPAWRPAARDSAKVRWADLADPAGTRLSASTQFDDLRGYAEVVPPHRGTLAPDELAVLIERLGGHTGRADCCWFAIWDGYGWIRGAPAVAEMGPAGGSTPGPAPPVVPASRVEVPGRSLILYRGPIADAAAWSTDFLQSPNLWWPADRAWCVCSEIDLQSTYLGGSLALVDELLGDNRIEAIRVGLTDPISNTPPGNRT
jgi:hypothetical protein